ncbi:MAG TPA: TetR/AcrR family transcriptional regulator [Terracidiphilus sp.]|nr:TetR/AcrR family transcriptional regulator [Terracidiphilus sp.]
MSTSQSAHSPAERSAETRARILDAALSEFSAYGLAGARTDRIAAAAGVNKALLYYYFSSKEGLYLAAFELSAGKIRDRSMAALLKGVSPGERILRTALDHFDRILAQHEFQGLMQQEMIRLSKGESKAISILVDRVFGPLQKIYQATFEEGISSGELISVDWKQSQLAVIGANVFYFISAPMMRQLDVADPFDDGALALRRKSLVEFLGQAIFQDRQHGAELACRVLADTPMPAVERDRLPFWRKHERA